MLRAGVLAQSVWCLLCKHGDLYLDSQHPRENVGVAVVFICNPSTGEAEIGRFLEFSG